VLDREQLVLLGFAQFQVAEVVAETRTARTAAFEARTGAMARAVFGSAACRALAWALVGSVIAIRRSAVSAWPAAKVEAQQAASSAAAIDVRIDSCSASLCG
jgi:hypothetical protein